MPTLLIVGEDGAERKVELAQRDLRIGRAPENDLVLPDPTKGVSRMHAELRFEGGKYVIIDLNSQNGTWVDGNRIQRAEIAPNAQIEIGPYHLSLQGMAAAPAAIDTQVVAAVPEVKTATLVTHAVPAAGATAPPPPAQAPKKGVKPAARGKEAVKPGPIAALARMPKPMLFGGFFAIAVVIVVLGQLFAPGDSSAPAGASTQPVDQKPAGESNAQIIARHLSEGKVLVEKGEYEAAVRDHFDRILLIDSSHAEATDLRAKALEKVQQKQAAAAALATQAASSVPPADAGAATTIPAPGGGAPASTGSSTSPGTTASPATTAPPGASGPASSSPGSTDTKPPAPTPGLRTPSPAATAQPATVQAASGSPAGANAPGSTGTPAARGRSSSPGNTKAGRGAKSEDAVVARRPGESVQAWRGRAAAIQTRYTSAKTALDRGDFAAAAAGFDAVLKEEPAYLDAPQLLIRSREGQRGSARDAFDAGNRLDAAGDWTAAMQKYELARQIDPSLAGLDDAMRQLREKMRAAGAEAFKRARQYDALGRSAEALKDYERAAQFLPADDPNRKVARDRADQLKAGVK